MDIPEIIVIFFGIIGIIGIGYTVYYGKKALKKKLLAYENSMAIPLAQAFSPEADYKLSVLFQRKGSGEERIESVYRELAKTIIQYREALHPLNGCKIVISALSTKLLSLGALLTAYELRTMVGIAHVEVSGYVMSVADPDLLNNIHEELFEIWLAGECYAQ